MKNIKRAKNSKDARNKTRVYNSIVLGEQNYYQIATDVNVDFMDIEYRVKEVLATQLRPDSKKGGRLEKKGKLSKFEKDRYGKSKMLRFDKASGTPIYPIGYVQTKKPICVKRSMTPYTPEGRELIHNKLGINTELMLKLMKTPTYGRSIEYADNRISLFTAQWGKCAVTGMDFKTTEEIHCHHIIPVSKGGGDEYGNLMLVTETVHTLIHAKTEETIQNCLNLLRLTQKQLEEVNLLRNKAGNKRIAQK